MAYAEVWSDDQGRRFAGIDVSKARLDVALGGAGELFGADNDAHGIAELVTRVWSPPNIKVMRKSPAVAPAG